MFDDQPGASGTPVPNNLPLGEPQDIFEGTESASSLPPLPTEAAPPLSGAQSFDTQTSALGAGILKPKTSQELPPLNMNTPRQSPPPVMGGMPPQGNMPSQPAAPVGENAIKEPTLSRGIMVTIMVIVVGFVLVGSGWFVYRIFTKKSSSTVSTFPSQTNDTSTDANEPELPTPVVTAPLEEVVTPTSSDAVDQEIITGESLDSDGDGLKDNREIELGTDPANWDTDTDDLSDGEELLIWHTNPKNSDTDGDTYKDGAEVKAGYSPSGPGRLAEITTSTPSTNPSPSSASTSTANSTSPATSTSPAPTQPADTFEIEL